MNDNYRNFTSESAFKNTVRHKQNTDSNLAWYEESRESFPIINTDNLWMDYGLIPPTPGEEPEFFAESGTDKVLVYKHYIDEVLEPTENPNIFHNSHLTQIIDKPGYKFELKTSEGVEVPFGLGKWVYDNAENIVFLDGVPEGWGSDFIVSFYRYEGRFVDDVLLMRDGTTPMNEGYKPTEPLDVATKKYVDERTGESIDELKKLLPDEPESIDGKNPTYKILGEVFKASEVYHGIDIDTVAFENTKYIITSPLIYNPGYGKVSIEIEGLASPKQYVIDLAKLENDGDFKVTYNGDYYGSDLNSSKFFNGIVVSYYGDLKKDMLPNEKCLKFKFVTDIEGEIASTTSIIFGKEELPKNHALQGDTLTLLPPKEGIQYKYISGIPHFVAGTNIDFEGFTTTTLNSYYIKDQTIADITFYNNDVNGVNQGRIEYTPSIRGFDVYSTPVVPLTGKLYIPDNFYTEKLDIDINTYNIKHENNGHWEDTYNFLIDTISNEDYRVVSKAFTEENGAIHPELSEWNGKFNIAPLKELLMLGGKYQYPYRNYDEEIGSPDIYSNWDDRWIKLPDYSECNGTRYATFKFDLPEYTTGINVTIPGLNLIKDLKSFEANKVEIKVNNDPWLDGKKPYIGVGRPHNEGDGCLVVAKGHDSTNYFTFGYKAVKGTVFIRIGLDYTQRNLAFSTPIVEANI